MALSLYRCAMCTAEWLRLPNGPPYCPVCGAPVSGTPVSNISAADSNPSSHRSTITVRDLPVDEDPAPASHRLAGVARQAERAAIRMRLVAEGSITRDHEPEYEVREVLARGGMGEVVAARQVCLDRDVVIKRLPMGSTDDDARRRFLAEAVVTGNLDHPNIVPIHELAVDQRGRPFYTMKRIQGQSWSARWRSLSLDENLDILMRICDAVAFAHAHGVVHRDLKPENVMLGDFGEVLVVDWGLAVAIEELHSDREAIRLACGTPAYMAPEMALGDYERIGPCSDIYLLGATLYELLTGVPPHPGEDPHASIRAAADNFFDPPIPAGELGGIAAHAMASDPAQRHADAKAFQTALREYRAHAQSARLSDKAAMALQRAEADGSYDDYARAMYGFEEAATLWLGNRRAREGAVAARRAYAEHALNAGDLDLAAGLAQELEPELGDGVFAARVNTAQLRRRAARRRMRLLVVTSAALLLLVVVVLGSAVVIARAERQRVVKAMRERDAAESQLKSLERRSWATLLHEDFHAGSMPASLRVVAGEWLVDKHELAAAGPQSGVLALTPSVTASFRLIYDWSVQLPHRIHLEVIAGTPPARFGDGLTVVFAGDCQVRRGDGVLARAPLPAPIPDLPQHLRLERDGGFLAVLADGREVLRVAVGNLDGTRSGLAITASPGSAFDNLHLEQLAAGP